MKIPSNTIVIFVDNGIMQWAACSQHMDVILVDHDKHAEEEWLVRGDMAEPWDITDQDIIAEIKKFQELTNAN